MIMSNREMIFMFGGLAAGLIGGILGTKRYFQKKYEDICNARIEEIEREERIDSYRRETHESEDVDSETERENGVMDPEKRQEIRSQLKHNWEGTTNYASIYQEKNNPIDPAESEHPKEDEPPVPLIKPRIISMEKVADLPETVSNTCLFYYVGNEVVTDEDDELIENPERLIGDCLDKYHFRESDELVIFVYNQELEACYEVQKVRGNYDGEYDI